MSARSLVSPLRAQACSIRAQPSKIPALAAQYRSKSTSTSTPTSSTSASSSSSSSSSSPFVLPEIILQQTHPLRYQDHYHNTLAEDLMYMTYDHNVALNPPTRASAAAAAAAAAASSEHPPTPYELNRPTPVPRCKRPIAPLARPVTPANLVKLDKIVLHTMVKEAIGNKPALLTAIQAFRAISGETAQGGGRAGSTGVQVLASRKGAAAFKLRQGMPVAVKVELKGDAMYDFIQCLVDFVLPRIREFPGFSLATAGNQINNPTTGTSGVISCGLDPSALGLFPQVEFNLDAYPRLHGFHIQFLTNARGPGARDQARALLSGMRIPFARRR